MNVPRARHHSAWIRLYSGVSTRKLSPNALRYLAAMTDKPPEPEYEKEAERRFQETLGRLVNTPPKPHKPIGREAGKSKTGKK